MTCPVCGGRTWVTDSVYDCESVVRRRVCRVCDHKFCTTELEMSDSRQYFNELKKQLRHERERKEGRRETDDKKRN